MSDMRDVAITMAGASSTDSHYRVHDAKEWHGHFYVSEFQMDRMVEHVALVNAEGPSMTGFDTPTVWLVCDAVVVAVTVTTDEGLLVVNSNVVAKRAAPDYWQLFTRFFGWEEVK